MIGNIIVAVVCNLIAVMILVSGIFSGIKNGWKISMLKLGLTAGCLVGTYFLTQVVSDAILNIAVEDITLGSLIVPTYLSLGSVNSVIFMAIFLAFHAINCLTCTIVRTCAINSMKDKRENKVKMIRAKSINPRAERMARQAEKKDLNARYNQIKNRFLSKFFGCIIGIIIGALVGVIVLMPYGYVAKIMNKHGDKQFLEAGYEYTLNGIIPETIFDFAIHNNTVEVSPDVEEEPAEPDVPEIPEE